jgi:hypothetical protein
LAAVLAAFGFDQAVEGTVGEALVGGDGCVAGEDDGLGEVVELGDVADGVVGVAKRSALGWIGGREPSGTSMSVSRTYVRLEIRPE